MADYFSDRENGPRARTEQVYCCVYVDREEGKRIISLRKANQREFDHYAENID